MTELTNLHMHLLMCMAHEQVLELVEFFSCFALKCIFEFILQWLPQRQRQAYSQTQINTHIHRLKQIWNVSQKHLWMFLRYKWSIKAKFYLACHISIRHVDCVVTSVSCRACSNMANDEEAVVLACTSLVFCALDWHQSQEQLLEMWGGHVHHSLRYGDAPEHVSCSLCSLWRACRDVLSDKCDTSRHDFSLCRSCIS